MKISKKLMEQIGFNLLLVLVTLAGTFICIRITERHEYVMLFSAIFIGLFYAYRLADAYEWKKFERTKKFEFFGHKWSVFVFMVYYGLPYACWALIHFDLAAPACAGVICFFFGGKALIKKIVRMFPHSKSLLFA